MDTSVRRKVYRIEVLITLFVISAFFWFLKFGDTIAKQRLVVDPSLQVSGTPIASPTIVITGPEPATFSTFVLPGEGELRREIVCQNSLYTTLIFPADADYRKDPRSAVYNSANECLKGKQIEVVINKETLTLKPGRYYLVVADQGASGSWYNPR